VPSITARFVVNFYSPSIQKLPLKLTEILCGWGAALCKLLINIETSVNLGRQQWQLSIGSLSPLSYSTTTLYMNLPIKNEGPVTI